MDLSKLINLIAEVAVKKNAQERSLVQTKKDAVLLRLRRAVVLAQAAIRMAARPSDRCAVSF